jgi:hypothetical protein
MSPVAAGLEEAHVFLQRFFAMTASLAAKDDRMCAIHIKLTEKHTAAESAYRSDVARMKETRGREFERAWRLVENRRASLVLARQALREHELEHLCGSKSLSQPSLEGT